ncbi:IS66 family insertion sequence element accessory protein TnpA [Halorhodospira halophila]
MAGGTQQRKRAFWREVVQGWAASGLSKAEYARQNGLTQRTWTRC